MICFKCKLDFEERDIEESHNVPCYLFKGFNRKERKNQADKYERNTLCKKCHHLYEETLRIFLQRQARDFGIKYFKEENDNGLSRSD